MEGIRSNVAVTTQQPKNGNKALKHVANMAMTTAGIGGSALGAIELLKMNSKAALVADNLARTQTKGLTTFSTKFYNLMSKIGNKLFPEGGKWHTVIEGFANRCGGKATKQILNGYKGNAVILLAGAIAIGTAMIARAYKAGKINGEG